MPQITFGLLLCLFLQANCEVIRMYETQNTYFPFYQLYTPGHLIFKGEFASISYNYSATAITFGPRSISYARLFKLPLIPPHLLSCFADISVRITVGLDKDTRSKYDDDPKFVISDGERGIGFEMRDELYGACQGVEGPTGDTFSRTVLGGTPPDSSILPVRFILDLAPSHRWGSCYIASDSGVISPVTYTQKIHLDQGLYLEMYAEDVSEQYALNYIIVEIHEN